MKRHAFTLIELLVSMTLIAVLATLTIAFFPSASSSAREARAASLVQSWLNIAKQKALRDQAPRGLRLWLTNAPAGATTVPNAVIECQYIEQPDDFGGNLGVIVQSSVGAVWNPAVTYSALSFVLYNGSFYRSVPNVVPNLNKQPDLNQTFWVTNDSLDITGADLSNGATISSPLATSPPSNFTDSNAQYWLVQPGDIVELQGIGSLYRVLFLHSASTWNSATNYFPGDVVQYNGTYRCTNLNTNTAPPNGAFWQPWSRITLNAPLPNTVLGATPNFRIIRAPRAVGDTLKMPEGTLVDIGTNATYGNLLPSGGPGAIDILFSPSGTVISRGVTTDKLHLWVRAPASDKQNSEADPFRGEPTLISIFTRTGFVGAYRPDPTITAPATVPTPYALVK